MGNIRNIPTATAVEVEKILVGMMGRLIVRCFVAEATCGPMETLIGAQAATFIADLATDNSPLKREYEEDASGVLMLEPYLTAKAYTCRWYAARLDRSEEQCCEVKNKKETG
ncbi:hypothetical protein Tco_1334752 [Tanacetum coccineum]